MTDEEPETGRATELDPWPAFVDLLAATSLLFVTLVVVFIFLANSALRGSADQRRKLVRALDSVASSGEYGRLYTVEDDGQFVRIVLQEDATFPHREWQLRTLRERGKVALAEIGHILTRRRISPLYRQVRVVGHTDQNPYPENSDFTNWELSAARAAVVTRYLVKEVGMNPCTISAAGAGPHYPLPLQNTAPQVLPVREQMARNRRIELEIVPAKARGLYNERPCSLQGDSRR